MDLDVSYLILYLCFKLMLGCSITISISNEISSVVTGTTFRIVLYCILCR